MNLYTTEKTSMMKENIDNTSQYCDTIILK